MAALTRVGRAIVVITAAAAPVLSGCDLRVITIEEPEEMVVVELLLRADDPEQFAWLHRTGGSSDRRVPDAHIVVSSAQGAIEFSPISVSSCLEDRPADELAGSCYVALTDTLRIEPGSTYQLRITLPGGKTLTGVTTVPEQFAIREPADRVCSVEPHTNFELVWTQSATAWIYAAETELVGIRPPLQLIGIDVPRDPLPLFGLSAARNDTSIALPREFGLFNRFDPDVTEALVVLQQGLPPGVVARTHIAAADRNYVNWVRGGSFNPSGTVRIPSVFGAGTGVFGSLVPHLIVMYSGDSRFPAC